MITRDSVRPALAAVLLGLHLASAQDIFSAEPNCAIACAASAILAAPCALTNLACQCAPATERIISSLAAPCISVACGPLNEAKAQTAAVQVCSSFRAGLLPATVSATKTVNTVPTVTIKSKTGSASSVATSATRTSASVTDDDTPTTTTTDASSSTASDAAGASTSPADSTPQADSGGGGPPLWAIILASVAGGILAASVLWIIFVFGRSQRRSREDYLERRASSPGSGPLGEVGGAQAKEARSAGGWLGRRRRNRERERGDGEDARQVHELGATGPYARLGEGERGTAGRAEMGVSHGEAHELQAVSPPRSSQQQQRLGGPPPGMVERGRPRESRPATASSFSPSLVSPASGPGEQTGGSDRRRSGAASLHELP